ncbi:MAG: hypothetical protein KI793_05215 [Rivularia sp. (in: Bacteria)]|nr:hypothetical protein [Rivularia sp. MS3]
MQATKIRLSILVGVSMLFLMPSVANAQNNSAEESITSQSSSTSYLECRNTRYCSV